MKSRHLSDLDWYFNQSSSDCGYSGFNISDVYTVAVNASTDYAPNDAQLRAASRYRRVSGAYSLLSREHQSNLYFAISKENSNHQHLVEFYGKHGPCMLTYVPYQEWIADKKRKKNKEQKKIFLANAFDSALKEYAKKAEEK
jgi:hypothetical protein